MTEQPSIYFHDGISFFYAISGFLSLTPSPKQWPRHVANTVAAKREEQEEEEEEKEEDGEEDEDEDEDEEEEEEDEEDEASGLCSCCRSAKRPRYLQVQLL